jgi:hypothetical protein
VQSAACTRACQFSNGLGSVQFFHRLDKKSPTSNAIVLPVESAVKLRLSRGVLGSSGALFWHICSGHITIYHLAISAD